MVGKFSYWFFLYLKNIQLGYSSKNCIYGFVAYTIKTVFMDLLLNSTPIPYIKSSYNIEISTINIKFINGISYWIAQLVWC